MSDREYDTPEYRKARRELLEGNPVCHWCKKAPATTADHLYEVDNGGSWADGMVPACKPCNSRRGAQHVNRKRANQIQRRNAALNSTRARFPKSSTAHAPAGTECRACIC